MKRGCIDAEVIRGILETLHSAEADGRGRLLTQRGVVGGRGRWVYTDRVELDSAATLQGGGKLYTSRHTFRSGSP